MSARTLDGARRAWAYLIGEPIRIAIEYAPQTLITSASVYLVAGFGASHNILPREVAYAMAIGFEWTLLRGWATAAKLRGATPWEVWGLNITALITVVCYGILYILGLPSVGVIPEQPGPTWGVVLAVAKVVPLALMTFFAMMLHRAAGVQAIADGEDLERARRAIELRDYEARLKDQRDAERVRLRRLANTPAQGPESASGTGTNSPANTRANSGDEQLRGQVVAALTADPRAVRAQLARELGIGRTKLYDLIDQAIAAGELPASIKGA